MPYLPRGTIVRNLPDNSRDAGDVGLIPMLGKSPGLRNDNPLQYSCLENSRDRGAWRTIVHGVTETYTTEPLGVHPCASSPKLSLREGPSQDEKGRRAFELPGLLTKSPRAEMRGAVLLKEARQHMGLQWGPRWSELGSHRSVAVSLQTSWPSRASFGPSAKREWCCLLALLLWLWSCLLSMRDRLCPTSGPTKRQLLVTQRRPTGWNLAKTLIVPLVLFDFFRPWLLFFSLPS